MFSLGDLWATDEPARDLSDVCAKVRQRSKSCVAFDLTLIGLRCSAFNPTIDKLPDCAVLLIPDNSMSSARFMFWTIYHAFM